MKESFPRSLYGDIFCYLPELDLYLQELYNLTAPVCRMTVIPEATRVITTQTMRLVC